jgi:hypothetical protein
MTGSAEAAPPQQIRRKRSWRLDELLNLEPCVEQGIQVGGQLAVGCAHPDAGAVGTVVRRDPPAFAVVACSRRPAGSQPTIAGRPAYSPTNSKPKAKEASAVAAPPPVFLAATDVAVELVTILATVNALLPADVQFYSGRAARQEMSSVQEGGARDVR